jgi:uncharacterized protein (TIGR02996 family)
MTHAGFLRDIIEHPDDDTPRLVYADWLDDHGQPARAALIRIQCELAKLPDSDPRRHSLEAQEEKLLDKYREKRSGDIPDFVERCEFRRGFVGFIMAPAAKFLKDPQGWDRLPLVREAWFHGVTPRLAPAMMASPFLAQLTSLDLSGIGYGDARAEAVAASPQVRGLTALCLVRTHMTDAGMKALASSRHLGGLRALDVGVNRIGDEGLEALGKSRPLRQLVSLNISGKQKFGVPGIQALAGLSRLVSLDLSYNLVRDDGAEILAASPSMARLERLNLCYCRLGNRGGRSLAASPYLKRLVRLDMSENRLSEAVAEALRARFGDRVRF